METQRYRLPKWDFCARRAGADAPPGVDPALYALYKDYHDSEWGVPLRDDARLFEFIVLESAQAGLSWLTILRRRDDYRRAFAGFDAQRVARFTAADVERLMVDAGIVRNRLKIESAIANARAFLAVQEEFGSFADYQWRFVDGRPIRNAWRSLAEIPATTPVSDALAKDLKRRGFRFIGATVCYAHMQAVGLVNDHLVDCPRHRAVAALDAGDHGQNGVDIARL